jgi:cytochrome P450
MTTTDATAQQEAEQIVVKLLTQPPQDPYPWYARLRELDPIHRASIGDFWTLTRYDDISVAVKDKRFIRNFADMRRRNGRRVDSSRPFDRHQPIWFVWSNPPEFVPKRAVYGAAFSRSNVENLRPLMADFANELLDTAEESGQMEVVEDLSFGLTVRVIAHALGVPRENSQLLVDYARALSPTFDPLASEEVLDRVDAATVDLESYLHELIEEKRHKPGEDLLSQLIDAQRDGLLSEEELVANAALVFAAGLETTTHFIGNCVYSLLKNRDQWELFKTDPDGLVADGVEELLRYQSSVQADLPLRLAGEDIEIGGVTIPQGDGVLPFYGSANRDPDRYEDPDRLDITRKDVRTLGFGGGLHVCLGQFIARAETQVALVLLAKRFPNLHIQGDEPTWRPGVTNRTLTSLTVGLQ